MFNQVIWATDGSSNADEALQVATRIVRDGGSIVAVHVVQHYATESGLKVYADEEGVRARLEQTIARLSEDGFDASLTVIDHVGPQPAHQVAEVARQIGADLIVTGTRGHGAVTGLLLGSVVLRLLHLAPCPVLAVPPTVQT